MNKAWCISAGLMVVALALFACGGGGGGAAVVPPAQPSVKLARTGQVISYATGSAGDDGALQTGVTWTSPRFMAASSGTGTVVADQLTGLMWAGDGGTPTYNILCTAGAKSWQGALNYVACLNSETYLGYSDWRLPNKNEMRSLINYGEPNNATWLGAQGFSNMKTGNYWLSTSATGTTVFAGYLMMPGGYTSSSAYKTNSYYVWPVRSGAANAAPGKLPRTGQTTSYAAGDDGALREGVAWPSPRFTSNADTTVTDNLTNLVWTPAANSPTLVGCTGGNKTWQGALDYVTCLNGNNYLSHSDWRLPNVNELASLANAEVIFLSTWLGTQGFSSVQSTYWSSTTCAGTPANAWIVLMNTPGDVNDMNSKTGSYYAWPVRSK